MGPIKMLVGKVTLLTGWVSRLCFVELGMFVALLMVIVGWVS